MSKRIGPFNSRQEALDFARANHIPYKEVRGADSKSGPRIYRIITTDAVYKRWAYAQKNRNR